MRKTCERAASCSVLTPVGTLGLWARNGKLTGVTFEIAPEAGADPALDAAKAQLEEYFAGTRRRFEIPLELSGTSFQMKCWRALMEIPYGESRCYSEIARRIGSPGAARAVGMANHVNPIPIIVPCHRVIGRDGSLTGYAGGLEMKKWLLEHEKHNI